MHILILGDFSGKASHASERPDLGERRPILVDRDNLDQVMAKVGPEFHFPMEGNKGVAIAFQELDDFHPDRIFECNEFFRTLRQQRSEMNDPATFSSLTEWLRGSEQKMLEQGLAPAKPDASGQTATDAEQLLKQILEGTPAKDPSKDPLAPDNLMTFLQGIIGAHLAPKIDYSMQAQMVGMIDKSVGLFMRMFLHHPHFQALESAWRALDFLVRRVETDANLKIYLLDVTKEELLIDLENVANLRDSGLYHLLVDSVTGAPGAVLWGLILGNFIFGQDRDEVEFLGRIAQIAAKAGAPFVAAASSRVLGVDCLAENPDPRKWHPDEDPEGNAAWDTLRRLPAAANLGLMLPRFLLRLPYGKETNSTEQFEFKEAGEGFGHENYLWGNPAFICGCLLGQTYARYGWGFRLGVFQDIEGLPLHVYEDQGDREVKPCAEVLLTERALEPILEKGLMPLVSFQERDAVRLANFQSLALPAKPLAGRWNS
jgi:type VI secretion system protein ImpC